MSEGSTERELFEGCMRGDEHAWTEVQSFVFRHLRYKLRGEERAREVSQQILLTLLEKDRSGVLNLSKVRDPDRFFSFLRAFSFSHMIDLIRAENRRTRREEELETRVERMPSRFNPELRGEVLEELELVFRGIERLREPCATILRKDALFRIGMTEFTSYAELFESLKKLEIIRQKRKGTYNLDKFYVDLHRCRKYLQRFL